MLVFLEIKGIELTCKDNKLIELGLSLAKGSIDDKYVLEWIFKHN